MTSLSDLEKLLPSLSRGEKAQILKWVVMASFYANENLARPVVQALREFGHDEVGREMRENLASAGCAIDAVQTVPGANRGTRASMRS